MKVEPLVYGDRKVYTVAAFNQGIAQWLQRLPTIWVEGVFKSNDGAASWTPASKGLASRFTLALAIHPSAPGTLYAGTASGVFKSTDGGATWTGASSGLTNQFVTTLAIDPLQPDTLYAGTDGGLFKSTSGGSNWTELKRSNDERRAAAGD